MPLNQDDLKNLRWASGELAGVLQADSVWTSLVTGPDRPATLSVESTDGFLAAFLTLREGIDNAVRAGEEITRVVAGAVERDQDFVHPPATLVATLDSEEDGRTARDAFERAGHDLSRLASEGSEGMQESRNEAIGMLLTDLQGVLCGAPVGGYLPRSFLCGLAVGSMAAGLITVWLPPHAHALAAVGLGAKVYKSARCWETH